MSVLKRRSRVVSFRLSEEEYQAMMEGCLSQGSRSLSAFARSSACDRNHSWQDSYQKLKDQVEELEHLVRRLTPQGSESGDGNGGNHGNAVTDSPRLDPPRSSMQRKEG